MKYFSFIIIIFFALIFNNSFAVVNPQDKKTVKYTSLDKKPTLADSNKQKVNLSNSTKKTKYSILDVNAQTKSKQVKSNTKKK